MKFTHQVLAGIMLLAISALAENSPDQKSLKFKLENAAANSLLLEFTPPAGHHFNQEAPSKVGIESGGKLEALKVDKSLQKISAHLLSPRSAAVDCVIQAQLYLCNDSNTYCVPVKQSFSCNELKPVGPKTSENEEQKNPAENVVNRFEPKNFIVNDSVTAFKLAKAQNKMVLLDFFAIWCPPCNLLDETIFSRTDFQAMQDKFVFLKMDVDKLESFLLKSEYAVTGYPTVMLLNADREEINRIVGSRKPHEFITQMKKALSLQNVKFYDRVKLADSGQSPKDALQLVEIYSGRGDYWAAAKYLGLAQGSSLNSPKNTRLNESDRLRLGRMNLIVQMALLKETAKNNESKKKVADLLEAQILAHQDMIEALDWCDYLRKLAADLKDEDMAYRGHGFLVSLVERTLKKLKKNPNFLDDSELSEVDLYESLAEALQDSDPVKSKENYLLAANFYKNEILKSGIPENIERAYNIDRAYVLHKGGKDKEAQELYTMLEKTYPKEVTFYYNHAVVLFEMDQKKAALDKANEALSFSYGDNRLRVVILMANVRRDLGQRKEALKLVKETLEKTEVHKDLNVRTNSLIEKLLSLEKTLSVEHDT